MYYEMETLSLNLLKHRYNIFSYIGNLNITKLFNGEWSVLTLGFLRLPCSVRDTA